MALPPAGARSRASLWTPVALYMAALFAVSSLSHPPSPPRVSDKVQHFAGYAGLGLVTLRAVAGGQAAGVTPGSAVAAWAIASVYGVSDEVHQRFVPGRAADPVDVVADALGAAAGVLGAIGIIRGSRAVRRRD